MTATQQLKKDWTARFKPLIGRTITNVRWMKPEEVEAVGWDRSPIVLQLDDQTLLYPSSDDEGNNAGALFTQAGSKTQGIPDGAPLI
jgi:hypothetical protein